MSAEEISTSNYGQLGSGYMVTQHTKIIEQERNSNVHRR